jgi:hypothetical protein
MNRGLMIFKRLQGGTESVSEEQLARELVGRYRDSLFFEPDRRKPSSKEESRLYDPGVPEEEDDNEYIRAGAIGGSYKIIGVEINGKETQIPMWQGQTPDDAEDMARMRLEWGLSPFASDQELEAKQNAAHQGPDDASALPYADPTPIPGNTYAHGTSNVGLKLFHRKQLKKP